MKIIGVEVRVRPAGHVPIEAKVIPLEIPVPSVFTATNFRPVSVEFTVHTSDGDYNCQVELASRGPIDYSRAVSENEFQKGRDDLRRTIEALQ